MEIREALEWKGRETLGMDVSRLQLAAWVKHLSQADVRNARAEHARAATFFHR